MQAPLINKPDRSNRRGSADIAQLRQRWRNAFAAAGASLPAYEEVMLGNLGHLGDHIILTTFTDGLWAIVRAGREIPVWLGRDLVSAPIHELEPDCALALVGATQSALDSGGPRLTQTHCARDGFVQKYELFAMPLVSRWHPTLVAIFVNEDGPRYSLVDAIFRSTEHGVLALATIRDATGKPTDFQVVDLNSGAATLLREEIVALRWRRLSDGKHSFNSRLLIANLIKLVSGDVVDNFELRLPQDGGDLCLNVSLTAMGDLICVILTDVTEMNQREQSFRLLFENNPMPMWILDNETRYFLSVNDAAVREYGYSVEQFLSMRIDEIISRDEADDCIIEDPNTPVDQVEANSRHLKSDGSVIEILSYSRPVQFDRRVAQLVAVVNISERRKAEARATYLARHDTLTGLSNRMFYQEILSEKLARQDGSAKLAVLCIDLDHFKNVNDSFGHPMGDRLLQLVANRLKQNLKSSDTIARLGGDEFAIILSQIANASMAGLVADRIIDAIKKPYSLEGFEIIIGASVGIALAGVDGDNADDLLKNADMALYEAKSKSRGAYNLFDRSMDERAQKRRSMETDLREAITTGKLDVYYQPLIDVESNRITSFEALLRWKHDGKFISPSDFIPLAEATGLISTIGKWTLRQACMEAVTWPDDIGVAVNFSAHQFRDKNLVAEVVTALAMSGLRPTRLEIEITESLLLANTETNLAILRQLKQLGVRIAMDDFGTGYSSLNYLRCFPFDKVKIDRSFVKDIETCPDCIAIVGAICALGKRLGIRTTAEGVESTAQLAWVSQEGCSEVQGYLFSPARPPRELPALIRKIHGNEDSPYQQAG